MLPGLLRAKRSGAGQWPMSDHRIETERRLTVVELKTEDHAERLEDLEARQITTRDWYMVIIGLATVGAAIAKKIDLHEALQLLARN